MLKSYKDLEVWKNGIALADQLFEITKTFPKEEKYSLVSQMLRSAISIPSNIAEGYMRQHTKEYIQFLYIASGSCAEIETQVIIAEHRGYILKSDIEKLMELISSEGKMLRGLIKRLKGIYQTPDPRP